MLNDNKGEKGFIKLVLGLIILVVVVIVGFFAYQNFTKAAQNIDLNNIGGAIDETIQGTKNDLNSAKDKAIQDAKNKAAEELKNKVDETLNTTK